MEAQEEAHGEEHEEEHEAGAVAEADLEGVYEAAEEAEGAEEAEEAHHSLTGAPNSTARALNTGALLVSIMLSGIRLIRNTATQKRDLQRRAPRPKRTMLRSWKTPQKTKRR